MKILAIRHGLTEYNKLGKTNGQIAEDFLVDEGLEDIKKAIISLPDIDIIYSSDLPRAKSTAEIIQKHFNSEIFFSEKLRDTNLGTLAGKSWDEVRKEFGDELVESYLEQEHDFSPYGGESIGDIKSRVLEILDDIKNKYEGKNVLIVTHGGIIRFIHFWFLNKKREKIDNVSVHEFEV